MSLCLHPPQQSGLQKVRQTPASACSVSRSAQPGCGRSHVTVTCCCDHQQGNLTPGRSELAEKAEHQWGPRRAGRKPEKL